MNTDSRNTLARNLQILCDAMGRTPAEVAKSAGLSPRAINGMGRSEKSARLDTIDKLSRALKVEPWLLLLPNLAAIASDTRRVAQLIDTYALLPEDGRGQVTRIAEAEARYHAVSR